MLNDTSRDPKQRAFTHFCALSSRIQDIQPLKREKGQQTMRIHWGPQRTSARQTK